MSLSDTAGTLTIAPGRLMPLASRQRAALDHAGDDRAPVDLLDPQQHPPVVDEDRVTDRHVVGQARDGSWRRSPGPRARPRR